MGEIVAAYKLVHEWQPYGFGADGENQGYGEEGNDDWKDKEGSKGFATGPGYGWGSR